MGKLHGVNIREGSRLDRYLCKSWNSSYFSYKQIFTMLVPLIMDQFFVSIINLLTTAMISSSSQESVSAVSLVSPIYMMIYAVYSAISSGGTVIIAQYKGQGDEKKMKKAAGLIVFATVFTALVLSVILILVARPLITRMFAEAEPEVVEKAVSYLIGCSVSFVFLAVYMGGFAVFRGIGETGICLRLSMIINLVHLAASFLFINGLKMDIFGMALSLNIARFLGGAICMYCLLCGKSSLKIGIRNIFGLDAVMLKSIFKISMPFALEQICFNGGGILSSMYVVKFGTESVAANAVTSSTLMVFYSIGMAVSNLSVTVVGQCIGAKDHALARSYGKKFVWLGEWSVLFSIALFLPFIKFILKLYQAPENTLGQIYVLLAIALTAMALFWSTSNILPNVMKAAGDVNFTSYVSLLAMWILRVGLGYVLSIPFHMGICGVWIASGIEYAARTVIFAVRFHSDRWLNRDLLG